MEGMNDKYLKKLHQALMEILDYIVLICEENHLEYCLAYGAALGAYRHHGFIPWDDDLDIVMPRDDYEKFVQIVRGRENESFHIQNEDDESNYFLIFSKVRKEGTKFVEKITEGIYVNNGIFVDIFPLDGTERINSIEFKSRYQIVRFLRHILMFNSCRNLFKSKENKLIHLVDCIVCTPWKLVSNKKILRLINRLRVKNAKENTYLVEYDDGRILKRNVYFPAKKMSFEGRLYNVPNRIEEYLMSCYGADYMKLPSIEKRVTHEPKEIEF